MTARPSRLLLLAALFWCLVPAIDAALARPLDAAERDRLESAIGALRAEDWATASALAARLPEPLATAVHWWRLIEDDEPGAGFAELARFREARPAWPRSTTLAARLERAAIDAPAADVARHFERFPPTTAHGRWAAAKALSSLGDRDTAATFARAAWRRSAAFDATEEALFLGQFAALVNEDDHRARLDQLAWRGLSAEASRTLPLVDEGYARLIEARLALRAGQRGVDARIRAVPPSLRGDPGLAYERIRWRRRAENPAGAAELLLHPPLELGEPRRWWTERRLAYRGALADGDYRLAYRLAAGHGQSGGSGFADSEWHAGWLALRFLDRPADALAHFERLWASVGTPISRARAAYWAGRASDAMGRRGEARAWYERAAVYGITFYGQEAALELGDARPALGSPLPVGDLEALRRSELGALASMLAQVDDSLMLPSVARTLVGTAEGPEPLGDAIRLAQEVGRYDAAIGGYVPLYQAGVLSAAASHPVPRAYQGLLQPLDRDVPAPLALAVARQESRFVLNAVSPAGARGLMQLMPGTARDVARDLAIPADIGRLTRDADYNARLGTRYLGDLVRRFGDPALVAVGYNAGPGRSVQWMALNGDPRTLDRHAYIDWLERIPFAETRNYVQRVIEGERVYAALLAGG